MSEEVVFEVQLLPQQLSFSAPAGVDIVTAARAAGIAMRSSCRSGTCRTCISRLKQGEISYVVEWPGLSREEKLAGWILPCVACAESALVIEAPPAERR